MIDIKNFASKGTLTEFKTRFIEDFQGVEDTKTGKTYYCPRDLGFNYTIDDCGKRFCSECWNRAKRTLELKENSILGGRSNNGKE